MKQNPKTEELFKFLDIIHVINDHGKVCDLLEENYDIPGYIASDIIDLWKQDRELENEGYAIELVHKIDGEILETKTVKGFTELRKHFLNYLLEYMHPAFHVQIRIL